MAAIENVDLVFRDDASAAIRGAKNALDALSDAQKKAAGSGKKLRDEAREAAKAQAKAAKDAEKKLKDEAREAARGQALAAKESQRKAADEARAAAAAASKIEDLSKAQADSTITALGLGRAASTLAAGPLASVVAVVTGAVAGLVALTTALVAAGFAMAGFGLSSTGARQNLSAFYALLRAGPGGSSKTLEIVDDLARNSTLPAEKIHALAQDLLASGVKGQFEIQQSIKAISSLQAIGANDAASKIQAIVSRSAETRRRGGAGYFGVTREDLAGTGVTFDALAKEISRGSGKVVTAQDLLWGRVRISADAGIAALNRAVNSGPASQEQIFDFAIIASKAKETFSRLFAIATPEARKLSEAMRALLSVFDTNTASGKSFQKVLGGAMRFVYDAGFKLVHFMIKGFLQMWIWSLKFYIAIKPLRVELDKLWQSVSNGQQGTLALGALNVVATAVGGTILVMAAGLTRAVAALTMISNVINGAITGVQSLSKSFSSLSDSAGSIVSDFLGSIAQGITDGIAWIEGAIGQMAGVIPQGIRDALGMHSPSPMLMAIGEMVPKSVQMGIDKIEPKISVSAPTVSASGGSKSGGDKSVTLNVGGVTVNGAGGGQGGQQMDSTIFENLFADLLERLRLEFAN